MISKNLDRVRSRLASVGPTRLQSLPASVQRLLTEDMPALIAVAEKGAALIPYQPSEVKLGQSLVGGWDEFQEAVAAVGTKKGALDAD